jgi:serine/threonine protein kinase
MDRLKIHFTRLSQLSHRHIKPVLECSEADPFIYYVTPAPSGETLRNYLDRYNDRSLPNTRALEIARDVVDALAYAHECGILHLDLSPECILIAGDTPLVSDFGVAHEISSSYGERITASGVALGTPSYMSPEAAAGDRLDARSDIYAVGCILYEMLAGKPPFVGMTDQQVIARGLVEQPVPLQGRGRDDPALQALLSKALAKDPAERHQTASQLRRELEDLLERAATVGLGPPRRPSMLDKLLRRRTQSHDIAVAPALAVFKDRYRVIREIGRGGMAAVFLAVDSQLNRRVALKVMRGTLAEEVDVGRFMREMVVTSQLSHPHVLQPTDAGEQDGIPFYVMPYVESGSIRRQLHRDKVLSLKDALTITIITADALQFVHDNGIIHRDIKPENILLHQGFPMLADFGIAHSLRNAASRLTRKNYALGTPPYWSPEQQSGDEQLDERTDVYSLAVVLYEMLRGKACHQCGEPILY